MQSLANSGVAYFRYSLFCSRYPGRNLKKYFLRNAPIVGSIVIVSRGSSGQPLNSKNMTLRVPNWSCTGEGHTLCRRHQERERTGDATESENLSTESAIHPTSGAEPKGSAPDQPNWPGCRRINRSAGMALASCLGDPRSHGTGAICRQCRIPQAKA